MAKLTPQYVQRKIGSRLERLYKRKNKTAEDKAEIREGEKLYSEAAHYEIEAEAEQQRNRSIIAKQVIEDIVNSRQRKKASRKP